MNREKIRITLQSWSSSFWSVPAFFFGISIVAFGLLTPNLGFYMDDWHFVYYAFTHGVDSLAALLLYDSRPYASWLYVVGFQLLGYKPIAWHLAVVFLRFMTSVMFWLFFRSYWKKNERFGFYVALLFLIFPFFLLQPMPVAYFIHWVGFFLYALSLYLMIKSFEVEENVKLLFIAGALLAEGTHLFSSEYFAGLELLRFLFLWLFISRNDESFFSMLKMAFLRYSPYLVIFSIYAYWRVIIFDGSSEGYRNQPVLLYQLLETPLNSIFSLLATALKDLIAIFFGSWGKTLEPSLFDLSSRFSSIVLIIMAFTFLVGVKYLDSFKRSEDGQKTSIWVQKESLILGLGGLVLGILPLWIVGKSITSHTNQMAATRFGLAAMFGAAILLISCIIFFVTDRKKQNLVIVFFVVLAIGLHLHNTRQYERSWEKQKNFYIQLAERIPALDENTALISSGEVLFYMGEDPTSYAINTIFYSGETDENNIPYWFSAIYASYYGKLDAFYGGMNLDEKHLVTQFHGNSHESLIFSYEPEQDQCLWVLRPEDAGLRLISELEREASQISAPNRIQTSAERKVLLPPDIFGLDVPKNWCLYYQRADLSRQRGNWQEITSLWEEAQASDKRPANGFEYIPFIEGYAHQNNWTQVKKLARQSNKISQGMYHILCPTLENLEEMTPVSSERDAVIAELYDYLRCE